MSERASEIDVNGFDIPRLQSLLDVELARFWRDFDIDPVPEVQDLRACLIAWVAVFLPEAVSDAFATLLAATAFRLRARPDFAYAGWYRALPLDVALFGLTGDIQFLHFARTNLDHEASVLRNFLLDVLALVADRLDFEDSELQQRGARNLQAVHARCEDCATMLIVTRGDSQAKRDRLLVWLGSYWLNPHQRFILEALSRGEFVTNPFLSHFLWVQQYVCIRLAEMGRQTPFSTAHPVRGKAARSGRLGFIDGEGGGQAQLPLFPEGTSERLRQEDSINDLSLGQRLWLRLRTHPLMASHVRLEGLQTQ